MNSIKFNANKALKCNFTQILHKSNEKKFLVMYLLAILIYNMINGIQGLNIYDEGFQLVGFQQILNNPQSVQYEFLYYLSFLCGGVWNLFFGNYGIYGLRILSALLITLIFFLVYKSTHHIVSLTSIILASLILFLHSGSAIFNHNTLTSLLNILAGYFLFTSLHKKQIHYIFIAGIILGINVFCRIPNIAMTGLILALIPFYIYNPKDKLVGKYFVYALLGFFTGTALILLLMLLTNHLSYFTEAISGQLVSDNDSSHSIGRILKTYINLDYIPVIKYSLKVFIIPISFIYISKYIKKKSITITMGICFIIAYCILLLRLNNPLLIIHSISTCTLCFSIYHFRENPAIVYLSFIGLLIEYLQPFGGDWGFANMGITDMFLSFPLSIGLLLQIIRDLYPNKTLQRIIAIFALLVFSLLFLRGTKKTILHERWYGSSPIWTMTYKPNIPDFNILLTEYMGKELETLSKALKMYVQENDYLFSIDECPISHFLTRTQPYLYNPLVWCYNSVELEKRIKQAEIEHTELPVVLMEKDHGVYYSFINNKFDLPESYKINNRSIRIYIDFLKRHKYKVQWENSNYVILLPDKI